MHAACSGFQPRAVTLSARLFSAEYMQQPHYPPMGRGPMHVVRHRLPRCYQGGFLCKPRAVKHGHMPVGPSRGCCNLHGEALRALRHLLPHASVRCGASAQLTHSYHHVHAKSLGVLKRLHEAAHQHGRISAPQWHRCPCILPSIGFTSHGARCSDKPVCAWNSGRTARAYCLLAPFVP